MVLFCGFAGRGQGLCRAAMRSTLEADRQICKTLPFIPQAFDLSVRWLQNLYGTPHLKEDCMPEGHRHLTCEQRCQIEAFLQTDLTQAAIARALKVDRSTISRELRRNGGACGYSCKPAHTKAQKRRRKASRARRKITPAVIETIEKRLREEQWSPDQISGRLALGDISVSHEWIYRHIWADKKNGGNLWTCLRHRGKKYNRRGEKTAGRGLIPGRIDISQRPEVVEEKSRIGDWEGDLIIGKNHKGAILSHVDRKSKYTKLAKLPDKRAKNVTRACRRLLKNMKKFIKTITYDNGKEFAQHQEIAQLLQCEVYFATPYHSWERGLNEHTNGLVRQYFPKGTDFTKLTRADIQTVEDKLNNRPRKCLQYKTPDEVFAKECIQIVASQC